MENKYKESRNKAIAFLKKPEEKQDFSDALGILAESGYKPIFINKLRQAGENAETRNAVMMNIRMLIRQWAKPESVEHDDEMEEQKREPDAEEVEKMETIYEDSETPIGQLIREFADLYRTRAIQHRELSEVGEHNDAQSVAKRKQLVVSIAAISKRMDEIYPSIAEFQATGEMPILSENSSHMHTEGGESVTDEGSPSSLSAMSLEELKVYKKNLATRIRRTRNKIEYRKENVSGARPNPLPEGSPKRIKLEVRIGRMEKEMNEVELAIAKFG